MKTYLKSLVPFRWIFVAIFIASLAYVLSLSASFPWFYQVINFFFWFFVDFTIGLGRREDNPYKTVIGVIVIMTVAGLLIRESHMLNPLF